MEEVDKIIIHSLKSIGCNINDELETLHQFTVEMVVEATAKCLLSIDDQLNISSVLPESMSSRFRVGSMLASSCQNLGYQGEIGYQTFLYANEHELRNVFMFLIEKLPKESSDAIDEPLSRGVLLNNRIASELKRQLSIPWTPHYTRKNNVTNVDKTNWFLQGCFALNQIKTEHLNYPTQITASQGKSSSISYVTSQPTVTNNCAPSLHEQNVLSLALENEWDTEWSHMGMSTGLSKEDYKQQKRNKLMKKVKEKLLVVTKNASASSSKSTSVGLKELLDNISGNKSKHPLKGSRFTHTEKLQFAQEKEQQVVTETLKEEEQQSKEEAEKNLQQRQEEEINDLTTELNNLTASFQKLQLDIKQMGGQKEQIDEKAYYLEIANKEESSSYKVTRKTFDLLPEAEENLAKLQQLVETSTSRLLNLNDQWEKHRVPLIEKYRQLKYEHAGRMSEVETKIEKIRMLREKMKVAADETHSKEELLTQVKAEYDQLAKVSNRSAYTKRILEIVGNIKKQKDQITVVLLDTKSLQKDINFLTGKLDRTFTVTDELIFKDVKKDEFNRKAYKLLASLHDGFATLIQAVEDTGVIMREIRDVEEQFDNLNEADILENLAKISNDLKQVKQENNELISKYKKLKK